MGTQRLVEDLARAVVTGATGRGHAGVVLQLLEAARARPHLAVDVAVGDAVTEADDHCAFQCVVGTWNASYFK
jgi:hypothetical protein